MFAIHCAHCDTRYLIDTGYVRTLDNTPNGPVAAVECPRGHPLVHEFRTGHTRPAGHRAAYAA